MRIQYFPSSYYRIYLFRLPFILLYLFSSSFRVHSDDGLTRGQTTLVVKHSQHNHGTTPSHSNRERLRRGRKEDKNNVIVTSQTAAVDYDVEQRLRSLSTRDEQEMYSQLQQEEDKKDRIDTETSNLEMKTMINGPQSKIYGGTPVINGTYPWFTAFDTIPGCSGSLIMPQFVLTSARCADRIADYNSSTPALLTVGLLCKEGEEVEVEQNCDQLKETFEVDSYFVHRNYEYYDDDTDGDRYVDDIALIKLNGTSSVEPVSMDLEGILLQYDSNTKLWVSGFGETDPVLNTYPSQLQQIEVDFVPIEFCKGSYPDGHVNDFMICASNTKRSFCDGDIGGPLYDDNNNKLVGVISWSAQDCESSNTPGVYSSVYHHRFWILYTLCAQPDHEFLTLCNNYIGCNEEDEIDVVLQYKTDQYAYADNSWKLINLDTQEVIDEQKTLENEMFSLHNYCLKNDSCYLFTFQDNYGDGFFGDGDLNLYVGGELIVSLQEEMVGFGTKTFFGTGNCTAEAPTFSPTLSTRPSIAPTASFTCDNTTELEVKLDLTTDGYPEENSWIIKDDLTNTTWISSDEFRYNLQYYSDHNFKFCLPIDSCYRFEFKDYYGDGLNDNNGFNLTINNVQILSESGTGIGKGVSKRFGSVCPTTQSPTASPTDSPLFCENEEIDVNIVIEADYTFFWYNFWSIYDMDGGKYIIQFEDFLSIDKTYKHNFCLPKSCYKFEFFNDDSDGVSNLAGLNVTINGTTAVSKWGADVGSGVIHYFGTNSTCGPVTSVTCLSGDLAGKLKFSADNLGNRISWEITNTTGSIIKFGSNYTNKVLVDESFCLPGGESYEFTVFDSEGGGLNFLSTVFKLTVDEKHYPLPTFQDKISIPLGVSPCFGKGMDVEVMILTDSSPSQKSFNIKSLLSNLIVFSVDTFTLSGEYYYSRFCLPRVSCYLFTMYAADGQGLKWPGKYELSVDGVKQLDKTSFSGQQYQDIFGCPTSAPTQSPTLMSQCSKNETSVFVKISTDGFAEETSWDITNLDTEEVLCSYSSFKNYDADVTKECCLEPNACYHLVIKDSFGDGIITPGGFEIIVNNDIQISKEESFNSFKFQKVIPLGVCAPTKSPSPTILLGDTAPPVPYFLCDNEDDIPVIVDINTDKWGYETSWSIINRTNETIIKVGENYKSNESEQRKQCLPRVECYLFTIYDEGSDGIDPPGGFKLFVDNELLASDSLFGSSVSYSFGLNCLEDEPSFIDYEEKIINSDREPILDNADQHSGSNYYLINGTDILIHVPIFANYATDDKVVLGETSNEWESETYSGVLGALLGILHWNNRIGVPSNVPKHCPIYMTTEVVDVESSPFEAVNEFSQILSRTVSSSSDAQNFDSVKNTLRPFSIIDVGLDTTIVESLETIGASFNMIHLSISSTSTSLENLQRYPYHARMLPSHTELPNRAMEYLAEVIGVKRLGLIYVPSDPESSIFYHQATIAAKDTGINLVTVPILQDSLLETNKIRVSLQALQESKVNFFLAVFSSSHFYAIMEIAAELDLIGAGKLWLFVSESMKSLLSNEMPPTSDSLLSKVIEQNQLLYAFGDYKHAVYDDSFTADWYDIGKNPTLLRYLNNKQSVSRNKEFFSDKPPQITRLTYDSIMLLGSSACELYASNGTMSVDEPDPLPVMKHHEYLMNQTFEGASGPIKMNAQLSSRDESSFNYVVGSITKAVARTNHKPYDFVPTFYRDYDRKWKDADPDAVEKFRKNPLPSDADSDIQYEDDVVIEDQNLMSNSIRILCLTLSSISMATSIVLIFFTIFKRENRVIKASQPPFLIMICVGTLLMASSIIPLVMDDSIASQNTLDVTCSLVVWFISIGFVITFSALFSKLWRLNKLINASRTFRRVVVRPKDVLLPFICMLSLNVIILIVWEVVSPLQWEREVLEVDYWGEVLSSQAGCKGDNSKIFVGMIICVDGISLLGACWQSYKARNVGTAYSESKYIGIAVLCIFQAFFFGIPILFLTKQGEEAFYFMSASIVFIVCMATNLFIFVPKILMLRTGETLIGSGLSSSGPNVSRISGNSDHQVSSSTNSAADSNSWKKLKQNGVQTTAARQVAFDSGRKSHGGIGSKIEKSMLESVQEDD